MSGEIVVKEDYGHQIKLLVEDYDPILKTLNPVDLSAFSSYEFIVTNPRKVETNLEAYILNSPGTDGYLYTNVLSTLNLFSTKGYYNVRARITNINQRFTSQPYTFRVID